MTFCQSPAYTADSDIIQGCGNKLVVKFADTQRDRDTKKPSAGNPPSTSPVGVQPVRMREGIIDPIKNHFIDPIWKWL